jgi:hypothetical protein
MIEHFCNQESVLIKHSSSRRQTDNNHYEHRHRTPAVEGANIINKWCILTQTHVNDKLNNQKSTKYMFCDEGSNTTWTDSFHKLVN